MYIQLDELLPLFAESQRLPQQEGFMPEASRDELLRFLRERRPAFAVVGDALVFAGGADKSAAAAAAGLDAVGLLGSTLAYAADLERIV